MDLNGLIEEELEKFKARTEKSYAHVRRSVQKMPLGVPSSIFSIYPYPITVTKGSGSKLTDLDGNEYTDYGNGYGTTVFGHAHPYIEVALKQRISDGVFFGTLSEDAVVWAELMAERFNLDWVRFSPSGTEANMDAIRLARAHTDRKKVAKIEGAYHGSYPGLLISTHPEPDEYGPADAPTNAPLGEGIIEEHLTVLPFNDIKAAEAILDTKEYAAIIIEPILFNVGAIFPVEDYLERLRLACELNGTMLIFDEVKTGASIARGGAEEYFGVTPDIKTFGKGIAGGIASGAIGGALPAMYDEIVDWTFPHLGTFSGNHLAAAAGRAAMELLDADAYNKLELHREYLASGLQNTIDTFELPCYIVGAGAKNCMVWADPADGQLTDFREYETRVSEEYGQLTWLWMMNRGVWLTPGRDEQTTHGITHTTDDADKYINNFYLLGETIKDLD